MHLLILEALGALVLLLLIVWWTLFSGRKSGELTLPSAQEDKTAREPSASARHTE